MPTHSTVVRTAIADCVNNSSTGQLGANGKLPIYSGTPMTGTVAATNGSAAVVGTGTSFTTALAVGQQVQFAGDTTGRVYTVSTIADDTHLTLAANYAGSTTSGGGARSAPINAAAALASNTAIAMPTGLNYGAASAGVSTVSSSTADSSAVGGLAMFARRLKSDGTTVVDQLTVGVSGSGAEFVMSSLSIAAGANVSINAGGTYTAPQ